MIEFNQIIEIIMNQANNDRRYLHCNIVLQLAVIDNLKKWNLKNPTLDHDDKFVKFLSIRVFTSKVLKQSTLRDLDEEKIRFVRGVFVKLHS